MHFCCPRRKSILLPLFQAYLHGTTHKHLNATHSQVNATLLRSKSQQFGGILNPTQITDLKGLQITTLKLLSKSLQRTDDSMQTFFKKCAALSRVRQTHIHIKYELVQHILATLEASEQNKLTSQNCSGPLAEQKPLLHPYCAISLHFGTLSFCASSFGPAS